MNKVADKLDNNPPEPILLPGIDDVSSVVDDEMKKARLQGRAAEFSAADLNNINVNNLDDAHQRTMLVKQATMFVKQTEDVRKGIRNPYAAAMGQIQTKFSAIQKPAEIVKERALRVLAEYMETHDLDEVKTDMGQTASFRTVNVITVDNMNLLPDEYLMPWTPDKKAIEKALKEGKKVPGASMVATKKLVVS